MKHPLKNGCFIFIKNGILQESISWTKALHTSKQLFYNLKKENCGGVVTLDNKKIKGENLNGSYSELASFLGVETVIKIHSKYRGTQMFFPVELFSREFIREQIVNEYNGSNIRELAIKYGYTEKWIRKIVKENKIKGGWYGKQK